MTTTAPEQLGRYRVTAVLGEGAMGVVYKGYDPGIQRTVALKTISRKLAEGAGSSGVSSAERFRNEARAAGRLQHPGIVSVYDYGDEGDVAYIAMEYVPGSSLARYLAVPVRFGADDAAGLLGQLLDALAHAHGNGVWHRDIKPANVIVTQDGQLKLADFGIARIDAAGLTLFGVAMGTPGYMAPEQFLGEEIDARADLYAAGVLLYQLLTGTPPFTGSPESLMYRVVHQPPVLPSALQGFEHLAPFDGLLRSALAKDRRDRPADAAAFKRALGAVAGAPLALRLRADAVLPPADAPTEILPVSPSRTSNAPPPTQWDAAVLTRVQNTLARHVGPLAAVLVRRGARSCADLPGLCALLAEQVTDAGARRLFLAEMQGPLTGTGTGTGSGSAVGAASTVAPPSAGAAPRVQLGELLMAQSTKTLAAHLGPIASVVVKRAAATAVSKAAFFDALGQAVADAGARARLRAELERLRG